DVDGLQALPRFRELLRGVDVDGGHSKYLIVVPDQRFARVLGVVDRQVVLVVVEQKLPALLASHVLVFQVSREALLEDRKALPVWMGLQQKVPVGNPALEVLRELAAREQLRALPGLLSQSDALHA